MVDARNGEVRFITPEWVKSPPPAVERGHVGAQFILGLLGLVKSTQTHGADSPGVDQSISQYLRLINPFVLSLGGVVLEVAGEGFVLNNRRIPGPPGDHAIFNAFMRNLIGWRIGKLEIHHPLDERELKQFIALLLTLKEGDENNSLNLMKELNARKIESISVSKLELKEEPLLRTPEGRGHPRELYFEAVGIVREIMEEVAEGKALNMRKAKRLMHRMVNSLAQDESILLGLTTIKNYGKYLYNHSVNVGIYSVALGRQLGFPKMDLVQLGIAGLFHDIGKIRIPKSILNKLDQLTEEEWGIVQKHPAYGVETIAKASIWSETTARMIDAAFEHHIKEDWTGYPTVADQRELTVAGRIIGIADFYDTIVRSASYQLFPIFSDRAVGLLWDRSGKDFDPTLVNLFVQLIGLYPIGTLVMLENGDMGVVTTTSKDVQFIDRPKVLRIHFQDGEYSGSDVLDLTEREDEKGKYKNSIASSLDPNEYQINVAELLFFR
jgi:HD-GYP domain-containing protein (c-di-GMP phosphodiesterase class II)